MDMVMDFLQQAKDLAQWRPENIHRHQAAFPRRHCGLYQHLLDVRNWRTPVLQDTHAHTQLDRTLTGNLILSILYVNSQ